MYKVHNELILNILYDSIQKDGGTYYIEREFNVLGLKLGDIVSRISGLLLYREIPLVRGLIVSGSDGFHLTDNATVVTKGVSSFPLFDYQVKGDGEGFVVRFRIHHCICDAYTIGVLQNYISNSSFDISDFKFLDVSEPYFRKGNLNRSYWIDLFHSTCNVRRVETSKNTLCNSRKLLVDAQYNLFIKEKSKELKVTEMCFYFATFCYALTVSFKKSSVLISMPTSLRRKKEQLGPLLTTLPFKAMNVIGCNVQDYYTSVKRDVFKHISNSNVDILEILSILRESELEYIKPSFLFNFIRTELIDDNSAYTNTVLTDFEFDVAVDPASSLINISYNKNLFSDQAIIHFMDLYMRIIDEVICNNQFPDYSEYLSVHRNVNQKDLEPTSAGFYEELISGASINPSSTLISCSGVDISGVEFVKIIDKKSIMFMNGYGIQRGTHIIVQGKKDVSLIVSIMALWKIGCFVEVSQEPIIETGQAAFLIDENGVNRLTSSPKKYKSAPGYIVSSSGSTGNPKKILINSANIFSLIREWRVEYGFEDNSVDTVIQHCKETFDVFYSDILRSIYSGKKLAILPNETRLDMKVLLATLSNSSKFLIEIVPSSLSLLCDFMIEEEVALVSHSKVVISGEGFNNTLVDKVRRCFPHSLLINSYGVAECTIDNSKSVIEHKSVNCIGYPYMGTAFAILNENSDPVLKGLPGELAISGNCVSPGYLVNGEVTKFKVSRLEDGSEYYHTGDQARYTDSGFELIGRLNEEYKLNGVKISISEIEKEIAKYFHEEIVIVLISTSNGISHLTLYTACKDIQSLALVNSLLRDILISQIVNVESWPMNSNGKIDRVLLSLIYSEVEKPKSAAAIELSEIIGFNVSDDVSFSNSGANSLHAFKLIYNLEKSHSIKISINDLYSGLSLSDLGKCIGESKDESNTLFVFIPSIGNSVSWIVDSALYKENATNSLILDLNLDECDIPNNLDYFGRLADEIGTRLKSRGYSDITFVAWSLTANVLPLLSNEMIERGSNAKNFKYILYDSIHVSICQDGDLTLSEWDISLIRKKARRDLDIVKSKEQWLLMYELLSSIDNFPDFKVDVLIKATSTERMLAGRQYGWSAKKEVSVDLDHFKCTSFSKFNY